MKLNLKKIKLSKISSGVHDIGELIHYGSDIFQEVLWKDIKNRNYFFNKPFGGLWSSNGDNWKVWCESNSFNLSALLKSFKFYLDGNSNILVIDSYNDLESISKEFAIKRDFEIFLFGDIIDFEKLKESGIDAIHLTEKGERSTRLTTPINLYGWDCETVLILNKEKIIII